MIAMTHVDVVGRNIDDEFDCGRRGRRYESLINVID